MPPSSTVSPWLGLGFAGDSTLARGSLPRCSFVFLRPSVCIQFFHVFPYGLHTNLCFGCSNSPGGNFHPAGPITCQAHFRRTPVLQSAQILQCSQVSSTDKQIKNLRYSRSGDLRYVRSYLRRPALRAELLALTRACSLRRS